MSFDVEVVGRSSPVIVVQKVWHGGSFFRFFFLCQRREEDAGRLLLRNCCSCNCRFQKRQSFLVFTYLSLPLFDRSVLLDFMKKVDFEYYF